MTQISDEDQSTKEEIERMIHDVRTLEIFAEAERDIKLAYAIEDLLSARETIRRLVENSKALAEYAKHTYLCTWHNTRTMKCSCGYMPILEAHTALMKELEGKG